MTVLSQVHWLPVRHHSPRSAITVLRTLELYKPDVVLIEGPSDATALIPLLADPNTTPPVALLGYRTDSQVGSILWPFSSYAPELIALRWAISNGSKAEFIDLPSGASLGQNVTKSSIQKNDDTTDNTPVSQPSFLGDDVADALGMRDSEEFWESMIEAPDYSADEFKHIVINYASAVRERRSDDWDTLREAYMLTKIEETLSTGLPAEKLAVVLGAAHVAAFVNEQLDRSALRRMPVIVPSSITLIPFSDTRLSEQSGYGAGNRAPRFFERVFEEEGDFQKPALEIILSVADTLRADGHTVSLADSLEAFRLAKNLASLRDKTSLGLDEIVESMIATMARGERVLIENAIRQCIIGSRVGKVPASVGKNSLQREFWFETKRLKLPREDRPRQISLRLAEPLETEAAMFLQRLRVADIPFAVFLGSQKSTGPRTGLAPSAGGLEALTRWTEAWEIQWTPSTEVALVERIVEGVNLERVCTFRITQGAESSQNTAQASVWVLDAVLTGAVEAANRTLTRCENLASSDDDVVSIAKACAVLSSISAMGISRLIDTGEKSSLMSAVNVLCEQWFRRACLRAFSACECNDERANQLKDAFRSLHDVALTRSSVDAELWWATAQAISASRLVHPLASGFVTGLLHLAQKIPSQELLVLFSQRLSDRVTPRSGAFFLQGFLEVGAAVLLRNHELLKTLDDFVSNLAAEQFRELLPLLRRGLSRIQSTEKRAILEGVIKNRAIEDIQGVTVALKASIQSPHARVDKQSEQPANQSQNVSEPEKLGEEMISAVEDAMKDLEDLLLCL